MSEYDGPDRRQAPYVSSDVAIRIQKWAIGSLVAIVLALGGWIFSYGQLTYKVDQVDTSVKELKATMKAIDNRLTEVMITKMDQRFRMSNWNEEEKKLDKKFDKIQNEINRLHKEINRTMDKIDSIWQYISKTEDRRQT